MKRFQPQADDTPPDDDRGSQARPDTPAGDQTHTTETDPMPRPNRQYRNAEVDFRGERRSNATHASTTDPDARLSKKSPGTGAVLCFMGHAPMENRSGLIVQGDLTQADGHAERRPAMDMIHGHSPGSTRQLILLPVAGEARTDQRGNRRLRQIGLFPDVSRGNDVMDDYRPWPFALATQLQQQNG